MSPITCTVSAFATGSPIVRDNNIIVQLRDRIATVKKLLHSSLIIHSEKTIVFGMPLFRNKTSSKQAAVLSPTKIQGRAYYARRRMRKYRISSSIKILMRSVWLVQNTRKFPPKSDKLVNSTMRVYGTRS